MQQVKDRVFLTLHSFLVLFVGMMICGLLAIAFGKEVQWDVVSYHYYNAFAFLHNRWGHDYWPPSYVQMFFNPFMDLFCYFLINYFTPIKAVFFAGIIHGINFWLIYCISYFVLKNCKEPSRILIAIMIAAVGIYNPVSLAEMGSFMGDNLISLFGLGSVLLQLYVLQNNTQSAKIIFFSGLLMGAGIGLKLTLVYAAFGIVMANLFIPMPPLSKSKMIFVWCAGALIGFFATYGYWMGFLWSQYHNPFFPFFNGIFKAPGFFHYNWSDDRFFPRTILQTVFYPFYFSNKGELVCDMGGRDYRLMIVYLLLCLSGTVWIWRKLFAEKQKNQNMIHQWIIVFFIFSYIGWQFLFSNLRYSVCLLMMAPLMIYVLLYYLIDHSTFRRSLLAIIFYGLVLSMSPIGEARVDIIEKSDYFNIKLPDFVGTQKAAMVITVTPNFSHFSEGLLATGLHYRGDPAGSFNTVLQTYLIPFFPKDWRFVGVTTLNHEYYISKEAKKMIQQYDGSIYLLTTARNMRGLMKLGNSLGLYGKSPCGAVTSDRLILSSVNSPVLLCQIK